MIDHRTVRPVRGPKGNPPRPEDDQSCQSPVPPERAAQGYEVLVVFRDVRDWITWKSSSRAA